MFIFVLQKCAASIFREEDYSDMGDSDSRDGRPKRTDESKEKGERIGGSSKGLFNRVE
jgi:hypothetical protein